jgi:hypothetical protein
MTNSGPYVTPVAFRRALTDRLTEPAKAGRWSLAKLQRRIAFADRSNGSTSSIRVRKIRAVRAHAAKVAIEVAEREPCRPGELLGRFNVVADCDVQAARTCRSNSATDQAWKGQPDA